MMLLVKASARLDPWTVSRSHRLTAGPIKNNVVNSIKLHGCSAVVSVVGSGVNFIQFIVFPSFSRLHSPVE